MPPVNQQPRQRSNDDWIAALGGHGEDGTAAVRELEVYLRRVLGRIVRGRLGDGDLGELVQESIVRVIENLESFRGDSAFTTWTTAIATRVAFTELRRRSVRENLPGAFDTVRHEVEDLACPDTPAPDASLSRSHLFAVLEHAIASQLTSRQRVAIVAELRGIPTIEIAERLATNQNALYKLTHDARKKLKAALLARGFTVSSIREIVAEGPR